MRGSNLDLDIQNHVNHLVLHLLVVSNMGLTRETRGVLNEPKNVQNGPELKEIWSKPFQNMF
jgi:hypothetical protein